MHVYPLGNFNDSNISDIFNLNKKITLDLLSALEENENITQRTMAGKLGVALGLANAYLKKSVEKGFVKIKQVPRKRYSYYITPKGFAEKAALTAEYFASSYAFFRKSKSDCELILNECLINGIYDVILSDISELAEITILTSLESKINILAISTSEIKLSVIIHEENTLKAVKKLHTIFDLD